MLPALRELVPSLKSGSLPLERYITETLEGLDARESLLQALVPENDRHARLRRDAAGLELRFPDPKTRPPLYGLLVGIKDLFNVDGLPTRAGSLLPAEAFAGPEAETVSRLKAAGALVLGKTVTTEFAYFTPGPTRNPVNPKHSPGGSSSGSAAAVAAGYCHLALGTQTIASVTRPAAYCGVFGFKPSQDRMSAAGIFPFAPSVDQPGFFCPTLEDVEFAAPFLVNNWQPSNELPRRYMGTISGAYLEQADETVKYAFLQNLDLMRASGIEIVECDLFPDIAAINASHRALIAHEFAKVHTDLFPRYGHLYSQHSRALYEEGLGVDPLSIPLHLAQMDMLRKRIEAHSNSLGIEIWITPAATSTAPLGLESTGSPLMSLPWTNSGFPTLCVPTGCAANALPVGLQLAAGFGRDEILLSAATWIERVRDVG